MNQAEKQFIYNEQLFAEGDAPTAEPTTQEPTTVEPSTQEPNTPAVTEQDSEIDYKAFGNASTDEQLTLLKKHGFYGNKEPEEPPVTEQTQTEGNATNEEGQPSQEPPTTEPEPEVELKVNGEVKKVKQSELVKYAQMGFDYTQKTQLLAEQQRQLNAIMAQQARNSQQQTPDPLKQTQQEYQAVVAQAERELGLQPGQFNSYDPTHQFALNRVTMQYNSQKLAQQAVVSKINAFMQQAAQDPKTAEIDANYDAYIYKLGTEGPEGAQKANSLLIAKQRLFNRTATMDDLGLLESHWNAVKAALTAPTTPKAKPVPQAKAKGDPPKTETPGSSVTPPKARMNYKKLGQLPAKDQLKALREAGYLKRG